MIQKIKKKMTNQKLSTKNNRKKIGIILFTTSIGLFFLFVARLTYIVTVGKVGDVSLESKTKALYEGSQVVKAKRGTIYDRNGVVIAEDATSYSVYAILDDSYKSGEKKLYAQKKDFKELANILTGVLGNKVSKNKVLEILEYGRDNNKFQVDIPNGKNITLQQKQEIEAKMEAAEVKGLYFNEHPSRIYPNGIFSSHLIGYADIQVEDGVESLQGRLGLEAVYDDVLSGKDGEIIFQKDNYQNPLPGTVAETIPAENGQDIYTTLDSRLQSYLETLMDEAFEKSEAQYLTAVLVKSKTNEIVSLSQRPTFEPETKDGTDKEGFLWQNLFVEETYEPGSTMKILTVSTAMDQGIFDPNEKFESGKMTLIDTDIRDWDIGTGSRGYITMRQALSWSSNVGMVKLEQRMEDAWQESLLNFGFGQSTNSKLYGEEKGQLPEKNIVSEAMSSFGQAIAVTQFQMLQAFSAISNDGEMLKPSFIKRFVNPVTGEETRVETETTGHPVTASSAQQVRQYMRDVVESQDYGTAYGLHTVDNYAIAAKTGTAEIAEGGRYLTGEYDNIYSTVLMLPAEDPEYTLYITMKKPKNYDGLIIPGIANPLLKRAMDLHAVDMADETQSSKVQVSDYRNLTPTVASDDLENKGLVPIVIGDGDKVVAQSSADQASLLPGEKVILLTNGTTLQMPDVTGWSKAYLLKLAKLLSMTATFTGEGYAVEQSIDVGAEITGEKLHFVLNKEN